MDVRLASRTPVVAGVALVTGAAGLLAWGVVVADVFFAFFVLNAVGTLVLLFGLGAWLIRNRHLAPPR